MQKTMHAFQRSKTTTNLRDNYNFTINTGLSSLKWLTERKSQEKKSQFNYIMCVTFLSKKVIIYI